MSDKKKVELKDCIIDFSTIPYRRELQERALYPFSTLNYLTGGMELGEMSIIAGEVGAGKTTFVSQTVENMIKEDKVFCIYGEGTLEKQQQSTYRQMTPYSKEVYEYVQYKKNGKNTNVGAYFVNQDAEKLVKEKTSKKLFYYDTRYGMTIPKILEAIDLCNVKGGIKYFLIDNVTQIETMTENEVKELKDGLEIIRRYLIDNLVHIILVAHYRKPQEISRIRRVLAEIMGTSASGQKCATALNVMRLDTIDKSTREYKGLTEIIKANGYNLDEADSLIEILKTRHNKLGFVPLKYNSYTNSYYECKKIGEQKDESEKPILYTQKQSQISDLIPIDSSDVLPF